MNYKVTKVPQLSKFEFSTIYVSSVQADKITKKNLDRQMFKGW